MCRISTRETHHSTRPWRARRSLPTAWGLPTASPATASLRTTTTGTTARTSSHHPQPHTKASTGLTLTHNHSPMTASVSLLSGGLSFIVGLFADPASHTTSLYDANGALSKNYGGIYVPSAASAALPSTLTSSSKEIS